MNKYFVLGKYFCKMCSQSPYGGPLDSSRGAVRAKPQGRRTLAFVDMPEQPFTRIPVQSSHLISTAGLFCRLPWAGQVTKESGLLSFSLLPVLPQNTLSNSFLRESPCLSWMYFRNAVVHWRVVALSVSALQKGTKRFSSSQQMRILRLQSKSRLITQGSWWSKRAAEVHCLTQRDLSSGRESEHSDCASSWEALGELNNALHCAAVPRTPVAHRWAPVPAVFPGYFSGARLTSLHLGQRYLLRLE